MDALEARHYGAPFHFLNYSVVQDRLSAAKHQRPKIPGSIIPTSPDVLAVNTLGQLAANPRVQVLRDFIVGWHLSYLSAAATRGNPEAGAQEKLSQSGDNLPNVIQHLREQHPIYSTIFSIYSVREFRNWKDSMQRF